MGSVWKNYASTLLLTAGLVVGGALGILWPEAAHMLKPIGDIFLNILFVLVVPLVFFSVTTAFCRLRSRGNVGKVLGRMMTAFVILWLGSAVLAYVSTLIINPLGETAGIASPGRAEQPESWAAALTGALTVKDFPELFSKFSLLPLIIFSALLGVGISLSEEKGKPFASFIESGEEVTSKTMTILMKAAPIGLGCYFAETVASVGSRLLGGYLRVFIIYWILALVVIFVIFPSIMRVTRGKGAIGLWWRNILPPSLMAMATESSSVAIPGNIEAAKGIGIDDNIAETVVPVGTNLLKAGSVMGDVLKVVFLLTLCGQTLTGAGAWAVCTGLAIMASVVTGAVVGGNVTGELLICTLLGLAPENAGIIIIIGTIIDIPATLVNSQSTVVAASMVDRK